MEVNNEITPKEFNFSVFGTRSSERMERNKKVEISGHI